MYSINALATVPVTSDGRRFLPALGKASIVGLTERGITERFSTDAPISLYGATKLASEVLALEYGSLFSFPVWINRCGVLAGAGQFGRADQGIFSFWIHSWRQRLPLKYLGFGGHGYQVRDCLHPSDLVPLILRQYESHSESQPRVLNVSGGLSSSISLAELSEWCRDRFGDHAVEMDGSKRPFDLPWVVLDHSAVAEMWQWQPTVSTATILESIATHAEAHPDWMEISRKN